MFREVKNSTSFLRLLKKSHISSWCLGWTGRALWKCLKSMSFNWCSFDLGKWMRWASVMEFWKELSEAFRPDPIQVSWWKMCLDLHSRVVLFPDIRFAWTSTLFSEVRFRFENSSWFLSPVLALMSASALSRIVLVPRISSKSGYS